VLRETWKGVQPRSFIVPKSTLFFLDQSIRYWMIDFFADAEEEVFLICPLSS
jgi:hypothetical protein